MIRFIFAASLLVPCAAFAQSVDEDVVILPRATAEAAANWIANPNAMSAVNLFASLKVCLADNPRDGVTRTTGADQCPAVTRAVKELADLRSKALAK